MGISDGRSIDLPRRRNSLIRRTALVLLLAALGAGIAWLHSLNDPPQYVASTIVVLRSDRRIDSGRPAGSAVNVEQFLNSPLVADRIVGSAVPIASGDSIKPGVDGSLVFREHLTIRPLDSAGDVAEVSFAASDPDTAGNALRSFLEACVSVVGPSRPADLKAEELTDQASLATLGEDIRRCLARLDLASHGRSKLFSQDSDKATDQPPFTDELLRTCNLLKETLQKIDELPKLDDRSPSGFEVLTSPHVSKTSAARWNMKLVWGGLVGTALGLAWTWSSRRSAPSRAARRRGSRLSRISAADRRREAAAVLMHFTGTAQRVKPAASGIQPELEVFHSPHSAIAENYRALRAMLRHRLVDPGHAHLGLIDVQPSEDGLVVAANLAASFALSGRRTLLIDCVSSVSDQSQTSPPQLSVGEFFGATPEESLQAAFGGVCELTDALAATLVEGLSIANWSMIGANTQIRPLGGATEALREKFDVTIAYLSSPPANGFVDASGIIDGFVRLTNAGETSDGGESADLQREEGSPAHYLGTIIYGVGKSTVFATVDTGRQSNHA